MKAHVRNLSKPSRVAIAQDDGDGGLPINFNPILFLNFMIEILTAVNNLIARKAEADPDA